MSERKDGMEREARELAQELFDRLSDKAPIPTVLLNREQFTKPVAEALEKCANEARLEALEQARQACIAEKNEWLKLEHWLPADAVDNCEIAIRALKAEPVSSPKPAREG